MKKLIALALSAVMILSLAACAPAKAEPASEPANEPAATESGALSGGWSYAASSEVTDELRAVLDKALDGFVGSSIEPVAYLGSQVVAGTNHCFLCRSTVVYPGAEPKYVLVYVYESFDGSAQLMNIADLDIGSFCEYGKIEYTANAESEQIANPFVDYDTPEAAADAAGFALTAPETVEGYAERLVQVMNGKMIQIIFHDADNNRLFIRKQAGDADISGDYNSYAEEKVAMMNNCPVTLKGDSDTVSTAIWTNDGYSYAVIADVPMSADAMTALIAGIR